MANPSPRAPTSSSSINPVNRLRAILTALRRPRLGDSGQAMIEACVVIPVLLALFLGLWHHALLSQAQTRSILAARHVAWARATLNKSDSELKKYAAPFFPAGTKLHIKAERKTSTYADYRNNLISYCATFTAIRNDNQHKITLSADIPALPFAPPVSPGRPETGFMDFLSTATTHPVVVVRNCCDETPRMIILSLLAFTVLRVDLLVEAAIKIAISEVFELVLKSLSDAGAGSSFFGKFMDSIGLGSLGDVFSNIINAGLWLINDLIALIKNYV